MELAKRWVRSKRKSLWFLKSPGHDAENRAAIIGPAVDGTYKLEIWEDRSNLGWEPYMKSADLKTLKTIGRLEAARRLYV